MACTLNLTTFANLLSGVLVSCELFSLDIAMLGLFQIRTNYRQTLRAVDFYLVFLQLITDVEILELLRTIPLNRLRLRSPLGSTIALGPRFAYVLDRSLRTCAKPLILCTK